MNYIKFKGSEGFTLIESIVAILVLTIALVPSLVVSSSVLDVSADIQNNLTAALLAQEGIELVRYMRDYNWLKCNTFSTGLIGGPYIIDINTSWADCNLARSLTPAAGGNSILNVQGNGVFSHGVGTPTVFARTVTITQVSANQLRVVVNVSWNNKKTNTQAGCAIGTSCISSESHLYNWK